MENSLSNNKISQKKKKWTENILNGKKESEKIFIVQSPLY
jgi:hypothetical protein